MVLFGGQGPPQDADGRWAKSDTWTWDGTNWNPRDPVHRPSSSIWPGMAYFPPAKKLVLLTGGDTWLWDGRDWSQLQSSEPTPAGRYGGALAYDGLQLILFGGFGQGPAYLGDTWAFDGTRWRQLQPVNSPSARVGAGVVQQGPNGVVIAGGASEAVPGKSGTTYYNDMWRWNGSDWTRLNSSLPGPADRFLFMTTQDTKRGVGLLFGGKDASSGKELNDLWAWDGRAWRLLSPSS